VSLDRLDAARWDVDRRPSGRLVVACPDRCPWRRTVLVWAGGYHAAVVELTALLEQHKREGCDPWTL